MILEKFGIYEKALPNNKNLESSLDIARLSGYNFLEISIDKDRLERLDWSQRKRSKWNAACCNANMPIYNMVLSAHRDYPFGSNDPKVREKAIDILKKAVEFSSDLGIRTIQLAGYYTHNGDKDTGCIEHFTEGLHKANEFASQFGVMLGIENMDRDLISVNEIRGIIDAVDSSWLKIFPDIGNLTANGLSIDEEIEGNVNTFVGVHLKDSLPKTYRRVAYGSGNVDFKHFFKLLEQEKYRGYLGMEMWNDNASDSEIIIKKAREWILRQQ